MNILAYCAVESVHNANQIMGPRNCLFELAANPILNRDTTMVTPKMLFIFIFHASILFARGRNFTFEFALPERDQAIQKSRWIIA